MKNMIFKPLSLLLFMLGASGFAQTTEIDIKTSTLTWVSTEVYNPATDTHSAMSCVFTTDKETAIEWIQGNGRIRYEMKIQQVEGNWPDINQPGTMEYQVKLNETPGTITITRTAEKISITLDFKREQGDLHYIFKIADVNPQ
jgi:hypothetical protein